MTDRNQQTRVFFARLSAYIVARHGVSSDKMINANKVNERLVVRAAESFDRAASIAVGNSTLLRDAIHFAARQRACVTAPVVTLCQLSFPGFLPADPHMVVQARITADGYSPSCIVEILKPTEEYAIMVTQHSYRLSLRGINQHIYESDPE